MVNPIAHEELKLLYEVSVNDIEFFKKQQWLVSYYTIVLYGALLALSGIMSLSKTWLLLAAIILAILASVLLLTLEHSIGVRRNRLDAIRENFSDEFRTAWKAGKKLRDCHMVVAFMLFGVVTGAILTIFGIACPINAT